MSASGLCASDTNDSMPWVSASSPVAALSHSGIVVSSRGSVIEMSGTSARPMIVIFTERAVSVTMQNWETSAPVPDVLGIISSGGIGLLDLVDAGVVEDVAAVAGQDRDALGGVDARAAAERDEHVGALLEVDARTPLAISWSLGFGVTSYQTTGLEAGLAEEPQQLVDPAGLDEPGVGDDHRPAGAEPGRGEAGLAERPDPEDDLGGVELDQRGCGRGHRLGG